MKPLNRSKILSATTDNPWVVVLVPGYEGLSQRDPFSFHVSDINNLRAMGPDHTLMTLHSKLEILLSQPHAVVMERLSSPEGAIVDFQAQTMIDSKEELVKKIREELRRAEERKKEASIASMTIRAFVRVSQRSDFEPFSFSGKDIRLDEIKEGSSIHGGPTINLVLHPPHRSPFDTKEVIIEGKVEEFRRLCREAYERGDNLVDMREYSMKKFKDMTPQERRAKHEAKSSP